MNNPIIAINDLCGLGHSSLAVALPVLSVMGQQVIAAPTAVLSSQTDGFQNYTNVDLGDTLSDYLAHWNAVGVKASALYSGYLAGPHQIEDVRYAIEHLLAEDALVLIDPVLGDGGELYDTMDQSMVSAMQGLVAEADLVTPNATELRALTNRPLAAPFCETDLRKAMQELSLKGPRLVVTTSFAESNDELCTAVFDRNEDNFTILRQRRLPAHYPGTGDLFASVLLGRILLGDELAEAAERASHFVFDAMTAAMAAGRPPREGVPFEPLLSTLLL